MWERNINRLPPICAPWLVIEPTTFWCMGWHSNKPRQLARASWYFGRDCIKPTDCFGCVDIIIMLILSIHEHGICSHLFESSDFFFNVFIQGFSCAMKTLHSCMQWFKKHFLTSDCLLDTHEYYLLTNVDITINLQGCPTCDPWATWGPGWLWMWPNTKL